MQVPTIDRRWRVKLLWAMVVAVAVVIGVILIARWLREMPAVQEFLGAYPGHPELPENAPVGIPAWLSWQHFLNSFFLLLIIRTGVRIRRGARPAGNWTRNNRGMFRTRRQPTTISLDLWLHLSLDALWLLNGIVFVILLFATGQWMRIVPTSWDVFPHALSALLQYASLNWPLEHGWTNYNGLQLLSYFATVFIAAPLAIISGLRMSSLWPPSAKGLNRVYPIEVARAIHFPVMLYFVLFTIAHVALVFATGALRNLNHMYANRDEVSWVGAGIFAVSVAVMVAAWFAVQPVVLRTLAGLTGRVSR